MVGRTRRTKRVGRLGCMPTRSWLWRVIICQLPSTIVAFSIINIFLVGLSKLTDVVGLVFSVPGGTSLDREEERRQKIETKTAALCRSLVGLSRDGNNNPEGDTE